MNYNDVFEFEQKAKKYGRIYRLKENSKYPGWNDEIDAFRHVFMQTVYSLNNGEKFAKWIADAYENIVGTVQMQSKSEKNMDLWNNHQGRQIAKEIKKEYGLKFYLLPETVQEDIIADKVVQKMRKGQLITNPSDKRKYTGFAADVNDIQKSSNTDYESEYYRKTGKHYPIRMPSDGLYGEKCSGSYPVSGYTRSDGKEVGSYVRQCYKHKG